jgi:hypothetical protein
VLPKKGFEPTWLEVMQDKHRTDGELLTVHFYLKAVRTIPKKKSRILYIKRYLEEQTDEAHPATVADIPAYISTT